jgi:4a-hydroxytetrahydrobiopterin dehydratase
MSNQVTVREFHASEGVEYWRVVGDGACTFFRTQSFAESVRLVQAINQLSGIENHPPDIDIRQDGVTVRVLTVTDDYFGMTQRDVELARQISAAARELGFAGDPTPVQSVLIVPGALAIGEIMPFWQAVLGYERRPDSPEEDLVDPRDRGPAFWFEQMEAPRPDGGGAVHIAVWVPPDQAEARVAAALAAGGRMVRDDFAPAWWTLADAAGNEVDVSSAASRD